MSVPLKSRLSKIRCNILSICEAIKAHVSNCKDEKYNLYYYHDHLQHHCFFPFSSTATRFHSSKLTSALLISLLIFSMDAFSKNFSGLIGTRAPSKRRDFSVSAMLWCLLQRQLSLVMNAVILMYLGRILWKEATDSFTVGFSLINLAC